MPIDPATAIGSVHLTIADLDRSIRFYEIHLGFALHDRTGSTARVGVGGSDLLVLTASAAAPRVHGTTGLYHFAVLVPSRLALAHALRRLVDTETVMQGFADHGVSESLYLADPDGNGIEIYRDRSRHEWPMVDGRLHMTTDPLDVEALLSELAERAGERAGLSNGLPADTRMGHVHLHVSRLDVAEHFYVAVLGFDVMQRYGQAALFVSAGGYHHHIGLNTWAGVGAPPPPPGAIGLRHFVVRLPSAMALEEVARRLRAAHVAAKPAEGGLLTRDPSGNALLFMVA